MALPQVAHKSQLMAYADWAKQAGWNLSEHSAFGGVRAGHESGSFHYRDLAIDLNWPGESGNYSRGEVAHAARACAVAHAFGLGRIRALYGTYASAASHRNHVHVDCGPTSNLGDRYRNDGRVVSLRVYEIQRIIKAERDNMPGPDSRKRLLALRFASKLGGHQFPFGVSYVQGIVGTTKDGKWGTNSAKRHDATIVAIQAVFGLKQDGVYGPKTDAALESVFGNF